MQGVIDMTMVINKINDYLDTFNSIIPKYLNDLDVKETTKTGYLKSLTNFFKYLELNSVVSVSKTTILDYKNWLIEQDLTVGTINSRLIALKSLYKWLDINEITKDIAKSVKILKASREPKKVSLTTNQISELLNSIETDTEKGLRDYALILMFITTGLRVSELANALTEDMTTIQDESVLYVMRKGHFEKDCYVVLPAFTLKALYKYHASRSTKGKHLFTGLRKSSGVGLTSSAITKIVKERFRAIGLNSNKITAHSLRHTAITLALLNGSSIIDVQSLANHKSLATTSLYFHQTNRIINNAESVIANTLEKELNL